MSCLDGSSLLRAGVPHDAFQGYLAMSCLDGSSLLQRVLDGSSLLQSPDDMEEGRLS